MPRIVYNNCYGGFGLSNKAMKLYKEYGGTETYSLHIERTDPILLRVIDEIGLKAASGEYAELAIAEVSQGTRYRIDEYDGNETVETISSYDWKIA